MLMQRNISISLYEDITKHPPDPPTADPTHGHGPRFRGWDQRGLPHFCELPYFNSKETAVRIVNGFHYGMDALDEFDTPDHLDWHRPGKVEERIEKLVMPLVKQIGGPDEVDLVQIHSGMWDLVRTLFFLSFVNVLPTCDIDFEHVQFSILRMRSGPLRDAGRQNKMVPRDPAYA
jgi:hypothetical protein